MRFTNIPLAWRQDQLTRDSTSTRIRFIQLALAVLMGWGVSACLGLPDVGLGRSLNFESTVYSEAIFVMNVDGSHVIRVSKRNDEYPLWLAWMPAR